MKRIKEEDEEENMLYKAHKKWKGLWMIMNNTIVTLKVATLCRVRHFLSQVNL